MQSKPARPLQLLQNAGIAVRADSGTTPAPLPQAEQYWAYSTADGRFGLWIYELAGQTEMDAAILQVEAQLISERKALDLAQNGEFLLVLVSTAQDGATPDDEAVARILSAFSGDVER